MLGGNRLLNRQFTHAFNHGDTDVLKEIADDDFVHTSGGGNLIPKAGLMLTARHRLDSGMGRHSQLVDCVAEGDRVVHWSANYPGDRCFGFRIENGKVAATIDLSIQG